MGAVVMKETGTGLVDRGSPVSEATLYIYCDACGSFNIKRHVPFTRMLIPAGVLAAIGLLGWQNRQWLMCLVPLGLLAMFLPWKDLFVRYKCRSCRNTHISDVNSRHYPPYDLGVVDVPDKLTQKRYIDTDVIHFQQFT